MKTQQNNLVGSPHNTTDTTSRQAKFPDTEQGANCPNRWCEGKLHVKSPKHPKANIRCDKCGWVMYLSNYKRLDERAMIAKREREQMILRVTSIATEQPDASHLSNSATTTATLSPKQ